MSSSASPPPPPAAAPVQGGEVAPDPRWPELPRGWWKGTEPQATFPVPFTVLDGFILASWSLLGQIVLGLPLGVLAGMLGFDLESGPILIGLSAVIFALVLVTALVYLRLRGALSWRLLGPIRPALVHVGWGIAAGVFGVVVIQFGVGLILTLLGETDPPEQSIVQQLGEGGSTTVLIVITAVVLAPLVEETLFRGVWFQSLRRSVGLWPAAIITSLGFGIVHFEVSEPEALPAVIVAAILIALAVVPRFPVVLRVVLGALGLGALAFAVAAGGFASVLLPGALASLGFVFAVALHRTGSLVVPIVGHAVFNGLVVALALFVAPEVAPPTAG